MRILLLAFALAACTDKAPTTRAGTDVASLEHFIILPYRFIGVKWQHSPLGTSGGIGPTDSQLDAQLWLAPEDAQKIHLRELEDGSGYDPAPFLKSPFLHGTLRREHNELILHLTTM